MQSVKIGDTREDGMFLYERRKGKEWWVTPEKFKEKTNKRKVQRAQYWRNNMERLKSYHKDHYIKNKVRILNRSNIYYKNNFETISEVKKIYAAKNRSKTNLQDKLRRKVDVVYRFKTNTRTRIGQAIKAVGFRKGSKTEQILGCSWEDFKSHIESQFLPGMSWENWGRGAGCWHVDHIIPLCSAKTQAEMESLCRFSNTQPLWEEDNLRKGKFDTRKVS